MQKENVLQDKSYQFLSNEKKEYVLSKQLLRCGTSIGANISEANGAISNLIFRQKFQLHIKNVLKLNISSLY